MSEYIRLMDETKSNASGFEIKLGEISVAQTWNPTTYDPAIKGDLIFQLKKKYYDGFIEEILYTMLIYQMMLKLLIVQVKIILMEYLEPIK